MLCPEKSQPLAEIGPTVNTKAPVWKWLGGSGRGLDAVCRSNKMANGFCHYSSALVSGEWERERGLWPPEVITANSGSGSGRGRPEKALKRDV